MNSKVFILYIRNFIFGAEDSLVSTVGLLAGIASAGVPQKDIVISGIILICVEAFSMSVGSFLSERTTEEFSLNFRPRKSHSLLAAMIMLTSYFICGLVPLFPYLITSGSRAFYGSILVSLLSLLILGFISAKILKTKILKVTVRMALIGGLAIGLGVAVGTVIK